MLCSFLYILAILGLALPEDSNQQFKQRKWISEKDHYWAKWCDWYGNDLQGVTIQRAQCGRTCTTTKGCTHFTWTNYNGGTCWMKKNPTSLERAIDIWVTTANKNEKLPTDDTYSICGMMKTAPLLDHVPNPAPIVVKSAMTIRHWDCCKPTCAWPGKADVTDQVMSCRDSGWDWNVNVPNAPDVCNGGNAYACNQFQPMLITDNESYLFASAYLGGQSERELCCACYELTFTNTVLHGKKKITVQVVSAAVNLMQDYFSLMIPGGGVGMYNGCATLFHTAEDGWGDRHTGMAKRGTCYQMPDALQPGCLWRFDWFMDATNPNVNYTRTNCPRRLIEQSNCKRLDDE